MPYCPRCGTALSSHELGQPDVYRDEEDESAYVRLRLVDPDPAAVGEARVARGVDDDAVDAAVEHRRRREPRADLRRGRRDARGRRAGRRGPRRGRVGPGHDAGAGHGARRAALRAPVRRPRPAARRRRVAGGAGRLRHDRGGHRARAPGAGLRRGRPPDRPGQRPARPSTRSVRTAASPPTSHGWPAATCARPTTTSTTAWRRPASCIRRAPYVHSYPHCWRCRTPLIYWGKPSWYIATSTRKDDLLAANATVDWHPEYIRDGRFGEWLANNVDWALSRDRYWGTPLPIWRCGRGHLRCVGSLAELSDLCRARRHRASTRTGPTIDEVTFACSTCAAEGDDDELRCARRVEPVIDAWFDSGSMPAAQVGYPHVARLGGGLHLPGRLHLRGHRPDPRLVLLPAGHQHDRVRREPVPPRRVPRPHRRRRRPQDVQVARQHHRPVGDPRHPGRRRHALVDVQPGLALDADAGHASAAIDTAMRDMLLTLWNTFSFFTTYASLNEFDPADPAVPAPAERGPLDRWILLPARQHDGGGDRRARRPTSR